MLLVPYPDSLYQTSAPILQLLEWLVANASQVTPPEIYLWLNKSPLTCCVSEASPEKKNQLERAAGGGDLGIGACDCGV